VERVRSRVSAYIYGNIFVLAAIFASSPQSIAHWSAVVIVGATSATTFFAHVVAHNIGQAIGRPDEEDLRAQLAQEARDAVPIMTSGTVPAVLLALGAVGWLPPCCRNCSPKATSSCAWPGRESSCGASRAPHHVGAGCGPDWRSPGSASSSRL
jgi:hypothetical protein